MVRVTPTGAWYLSANYVYKLDTGLTKALLPYLENKTLFDIDSVL